MTDQVTTPAVSTEVPLNVSIFVPQPTVLQNIHMVITFIQLLGLPQTTTRVVTNLVISHHKAKALLTLLAITPIFFLKRAIIGEQLFSMPMASLLKTPDQANQQIR